MSYRSYGSYRGVQDCQCDGTADCADFGQIKGVLAHAGLPEYFHHKGHKGHKEAAQKAGRACARRTSGPGACRGVAGFARHALGKGR